MQKTKELGALILGLLDTMLERESDMVVLPSDLEVIPAERPFVLDGTTPEHDTLAAVFSQYGDRFVLSYSRQWYLDGKEVELSTMWLGTTTDNETGARVETFKTFLFSRYWACNVGQFEWSKLTYIGEFID